MGLGLDPEHGALRAVTARVLDAHPHRLGGRGGLVEQGRIGHRQRREVLDHGLEVDERLEAALRYLGLVRRVLRVPAGILEHVAQDHRRRDRVVVALTDERSQHHVVGREVLHLLEQLVLTQRQALAERERLGEHARGGDHRGGELVEALVTERGEHLIDLGLARRDVAAGKRIGRCQDVVMHGRNVPRYSSRGAATARAGNEADRDHDQPFGHCVGSSVPRRQYKSASVAVPPIERSARPPTSLVARSMAGSSPFDSWPPPWNVKPTWTYSPENRSAKWLPRMTSTAAIASAP